MRKLSDKTAKPTRRWWLKADGFTYLEIAMFVAVLGIIAGILYPHYLEWRERAREAVTKANISAIKAAISIYYGDHEGIWPTTLDSTDKTPGFGFGDYLPVMPKVSATHPVASDKSPAGNEITYKAFTDEPSLAVPGISGQGWRYDGPKNSNTGRIWVNNSCLDTTGVSYTTYGYQ